MVDRTLTYWGDWITVVIFDLLLPTHDVITALCNSACNTFAFVNGKTISVSLDLSWLTKQYNIMKLDTKAMRHLTSEDWRVLTAVCFSLSLALNVNP